MAGVSVATVQPSSRSFLFGEADVFGGLVELVAAGTGCSSRRLTARFSATLVRT